MKRSLLTVAFVLFLCCAVFGRVDLFEVLPENEDYAPRFEPGAWVEYRFTDENGETGTFKFSVLSKEDCDGKECYSFEYKMTDKEGNWIITNFTAADPQDKGTFVSLVVQRQGEPARRMDSMLEKTGLTEKAARAKAKETEATFAVDEGVKVKVAAGSFEADRVTITQEDEQTTAWISDDVPILGLVKAEQADESGAELIGFGTEGAESEIEGEIQDMGIPALNNLMRMAVPPEEQ